MKLPALFVVLACAAAAGGCSAVAAVTGGGAKIVSVTVIVPAGLLVGDSAIATAVAMGDDGRDHPGRTRRWSSSDPAALSIDANGKMTALIAGRTVTITCDVEGVKGTAPVVITSDDSRFGYALADQPSAAGPYVPAADTRFNSGGGTIEVTRTSVGVYSVRFEGLGRKPGQRDNVQVTAYNTVAAYCKPQVWNASGADLIVPVGCFAANGTPTDSRFTVLALGARAFGRTAALGFLLDDVDIPAIWLDSSVTAYNSSGGHPAAGHVGVGSYAVEFEGLASAWASAPVGIMVSAVGQGTTRCHAGAVDALSAGIGIGCNLPTGQLVNSPFSLLWLQRGRPNMRTGFAFANQESSNLDYSPDPLYSFNSSGGAIASRKTGPGTYRVVFAGLGKAPGATETVMVAPFLFEFRICTITSWSNSGVNDLTVNVACFDNTSAPAATRYEILVLQ